MQHYQLQMASHAVAFVLLSMRMQSWGTTAGHFAAVLFCKIGSEHATHTPCMCGHVCVTCGCVFWSNLRIQIQTFKTAKIFWVSTSSTADFDLITRRTCILQRGDLQCNIQFEDSFSKIFCFGCSFFLFRRMHRIFMSVVFTYFKCYPYWLIYVLVGYWLIYVHANTTVQP